MSVGGKSLLEVLSFPQRRMCKKFVSTSREQEEWMFRSSTASKNYPTVQELIELGSPYYRLFATSSEWTIRAIDKTEIIDRQPIRRSLSFDIDFQYVRHVLSGKPLRSGRLRIPLAQLNRHELIEVNVDGPWNGQISLASRRENARLSTIVIFGRMLDKKTSQAKRDLCF